MEKIKWALKQLFPLMYRTRYGKDGKQYYVTWRMWLGRCFSMEEVQVAE